MFLNCSGPGGKPGPGLRPDPLLYDRSIIFWRSRADRIYTRIAPSTRYPYVTQPAL
jgi:hypothetical protein